MYRVRSTVAQTTSSYQEILIAETEDFGRALFLDGIPQSSALDEHIYHEALVHPALIAHNAPQSVFVAGGGEGAILREILKHNTIQKVVMCDIDTVMLDFARDHLYDWHQGAFDDPRVQVLCEDARAYLANSPNTFDCIIVDMTDPLENSPAALLFTHEFFLLAKSRLAPGGTFAMQAEAADITDYSAHVSVIKTLRKCFNSVLSYQTWISFYGLAWGFAVASDEPLEQRLSADSLAQKLHERNCQDLRFYDTESHLHLFSTPKYLRDAIQDSHTGAIIYDDQPLVVE